MVRLYVRFLISVECMRVNPWGLYSVYHVFRYGSDDDWPALASLAANTPGEEEKVKAEKLSQTTTSLPNKLTLYKINSARKGSSLKPSLNGEEEKVKEELSQTTTSLPNKLTLYKINSEPKGSSLKPSLNWEEEKVKAEKLSQTTTFRQYLR